MFNPSTPLDPDLFAAAFLAGEDLRSMQSYLAAGRRCQHVVLDDLRKLALLAFREWAAHPRQLGKMRVWEDACCEIQLRGEEPPPFPATDFKEIRRLASELLNEPWMEEALEARFLETLKTLTDPRNRN